MFMAKMKNDEDCELPYTLPKLRLDSPGGTSWMLRIFATSLLQQQNLLRVIKSIIKLVPILYDLHLVLSLSFQSPNYFTRLRENKVWHNVYIDISCFSFCFYFQQKIAKSKIWPFLCSRARTNIVAREWNT